MHHKYLKFGVFLSWLGATGCGVKGDPQPYITSDMVMAEEAAKAKAAAGVVETPTPTPVPSPTPTPKRKGKAKQR